MTTHSNPLLQPWPGPYGGVPPWDQVRVDQLVDQFQVALKAAQQEIQAIADQRDPATFENTFLAMETAGQPLERLQRLFGVHSSNLNTDAVAEVERQVAPQLAAHADGIIQNAALFHRMETVHQNRERDRLDPVQSRLVDQQYKTFVRRGARLNAAEKQRLSQINQRLARLFTDFNQNVLEDESRYITWIDHEEDLAGLPASQIAAMASAAQQAVKDGAEGTQDGAPGRWAVLNTRSSMEPFLTYADNRRLRDTVWRNYYSRCDHNDAYDNKAIIREIVALRYERARLLGYASHAHWRLDSTMAQTPQAAEALMMAVWPKAVERVRQEVAQMQALADREADAAGSERLVIQPWDYRYYAEKVRKQQYDLDFNQVEPYLQLDRLRAGMMWVAETLWDLRFREITARVPTFHPDVTVWEVVGEGERPIGLFYFDPYARSGKRSGAWMSEYRAQSRIPERTLPIVSNNCNFVKSGKTGPTLISWDDAVTLFHEFGHALHGLMSDVDYRSQAGTRVSRDYVEFPSQILEHWLSTPEVLQRFAIHHQNGQPLPAELLEKIRAAAQFNQGFDTVEFLASAIVDMRIHTLDTGEIDVAAIEREILQQIGMPAEIVMRHRLPHFSHLFSSDSYSAGYYSYLWADALTADAAEAFEQAPGQFFDAAVARRLADEVLSVGDTVAAEVSYRRFRGRDVDTAALLRKRGFAD